jgi:IS4 transposase
MGNLAFFSPGRAVMQASFFKDLMFRAFAKERPIATVTQMVLRRMLSPTELDRLFEEHAKAQYFRSLLFSALARLICGVVLSKYASVNAGFKKMTERLGVSLTAVYEKLRRVELAVSQQLVRQAYRQAVAICQEIGFVARHDLAGYSTRILDGNWLAGTEHRLKETRKSTAAPLPGKSLVVYDPRYDAACDFFPIEDAYRQERSGLDEVIETIERRQLWIADRNFCTLKFLYAIADKGSAFVIRLHDQLHGVEQGRLRKIGETETGVVYENELVLPEYQGQQMTVRRVVVHLFAPTRDKDVEIVLLTNLPVEDATARDVAELYRTRWKIETAFGHMALAMNCEIKPLCYPQAALFCFALALVAYNAFAITKGAIAAEHGREECEMLSHYYMAHEISHATDGMLIAIPEARWDEMETIPTADFAAEVRTILRGMDLSCYRKSIRGPKKPQPKRTNKRNSVHVSTKRILDKRREKAY